MEILYHKVHKMIFALTAFGLVIIPFYEVIFRLFPNVVVLAADTRSHKEIMAVTVALVIGLLALYRGNLKPFKNKWLLLFVGLQMITINLMPKIPLVINNIDNSGFWVWKPMFEILCFLLMGVTIASIAFSRKQIDTLLTIMCWVGFGMSIYVILQSLGLDQFFVVKGEEIIGKVGFPNRVGSLGQPTLVSPFIAMIVPVSLYLKKYLLTIVMAIGVVLTCSQMAIGALIVGLLAYLCLARPRSSFLIVPIAVLTSMHLFTNKILTFQTSGRIGAWTATVQDIFKTSIQGYAGRDFSLFGHGLGSFSYLSSAIESSKFASAHNDFLEVFYCCGIFGLILFIFALIYLLIKSCQNWLRYADYKKPMTASLMCSFLIISLCALGGFVWQLGAHCYYSVVIAGLLSNETRGGYNA